MHHGYSAPQVRYSTANPFFHVFPPFRVLARVCKRGLVNGWRTSYCVIQKDRDRKEGAKKRPDAGREGFHKQRPLLIPLLQFCSPPDNTAHDINRGRTLDKELWSRGDQHMPVFLRNATLRPHRSFDDVIPPLWPPAVSLWPCW